MNFLFWSSGPYQLFLWVIFDLHPGLLREFRALQLSSITANFEPLKGVCTLLVEPIIHERDVYSSTIGQLIKFAVRTPQNDRKDKTRVYVRRIQYLSFLVCEVKEGQGEVRDGAADKNWTRGGRMSVWLKTKRNGGRDGEGKSWAAAQSFSEIRALLFKCRQLEGGGKSKANKENSSVFYLILNHPHLCHELIKMTAMKLI